MEIVQILSQRLGEFPQELWESSQGGMCGTLSLIEGCVGPSPTLRHVGTSLTRRDVWDPLTPGLRESPLTPRDVPHTGALGPSLTRGAVGTPLTQRDMSDLLSH